MAEHGGRPTHGLMPVPAPGFATLPRQKGHYAPVYIDLLEPAHPYRVAYCRRRLSRSRLAPERVFFGKSFNPLIASVFYRQQWFEPIYHSNRPQHGGLLDGGHRTAAREFGSISIIVHSNDVGMVDVEGLGTGNPFMPMCSVQIPDLLRSFTVQVPSLLL